MYMYEYYSKVRSEMLAFVPLSASNILEIGCADGNFGAAIKKRQKSEVWGVELEPSIAKLAEKNLDRVLIGPADKCLEGLEDSRFDCVIFNDVLEHMAFPEILLNDLKRVLKENAVIVGSIPNIRYFPIFLSYIWSADWKYAEYGVLDRTHLRFYTGKSLNRFFKIAGYRVLEIQGINPTPGLRALLLRVLSFGFFEDTKFEQYAFVVVPEDIKI